MNRADTYLQWTTVQLAYTRLNNAVETRPLTSMAERHQVLSSLDELFLRFVVQRLLVPEPRTKAPIITVRWPLKSIQVASLDQQFV